MVVARKMEGRTEEGIVLHNYLKVYFFSLYVPIEGEWDEIQQLYGPVILDCSSKYFIGATVGI